MTGLRTLVQGELAMGEQSRTSIWTRTNCFVSCCVAIIAMSEQATACSIAGPIENYIELAARSVRHFWLAAILLGGLILCLDIYEKKVSVPLLAAGTLLLLLGLLLYRSPHWGVFAPDCSFPLLQASQLVFGLISALLVYRLFRAIRSN